MTSEFTVAVHALTFLNHKGTMVSSDALARNVCTNPARIRKIMAKLKKQRLVETKEGLEGGYRVKSDSGELTLQKIAEALEVTFVSSSWKSGNKEMDCMIASGMADIMDEICGDLDDLCKERLKKIRIADIDAYIFKKGSMLSKR